VLNKRHIKAPRHHHPGKGHPREHLAYLNKAEMEMLRVLTDGVVEKGPKGIPSFAINSPDAKSFGGGTSSSSPSGGFSQSVFGTGGGGDSKSGSSGGGQSTPSSAAKSSTTQAAKSPAAAPKASAPAAAKAPAASTSKGPAASMAAAKASAAKAPAASVSKPKQASPPQNFASGGGGGARPAAGLPAKPSGGFSQTQFGSGNSNKTDKPAASAMAAPKGGFSQQVFGGIAAPAKPTGGFSQQVFGGVPSPAKRMPGPFGGGLPPAFGPNANLTKIANMEGLKPGVTDAWNKLQKAFKNPGTIISAYRSPLYNKKVGGARKSQHMHGNAIDVDVKHLSIPERQNLIRAAREAGFTGIGVYKNSLHFDVGPARNWGPTYKAASTPSWAREALTGKVATPAAVAAAPSAPAKPSGYQTAAATPTGPAPRPQARPWDGQPMAMARPWDAPPIPQARPANLGVTFGDQSMGRTVNPYSAPPPRPTARPENFKSVAGMSFTPGLPAAMPPSAPIPTARPADLTDPRRMAAGTYTSPYDVAAPRPTPRPPSQNMQRQAAQYSGYGEFNVPAVPQRMAAGTYTEPYDVAPPPRQAAGTYTQPYDVPPRQAAGTYTEPYNVPLRQAAGTYTTPYDAPPPAQERQNPFAEHANEGLPPGYAERYGLGQPAAAVAPPASPGGLGGPIGGLVQGGKLLGNIAAGNVHIPGDAIRAGLSDPNIGRYAKARAAGLGTIADAAAGRVIGPAIRGAFADALGGVQNFIKNPPAPSRSEQAAEQPRGEDGRFTERSEKPADKSAPTASATRKGKARSSVDGGKGSPDPRIIIPGGGGGGGGGGTSSSRSSAPRTPFPAPPPVDWSYYNTVMTPEEIRRRLLGENW
jgi:hypothetical protein